MDTSWEELFQSLTPLATFMFMGIVSIVVIQLMFIVRLWRALGDITEIKKLLEDKLNSNQNQK